MTRTLKLTALGLIAAGIAVTLYLSGVSVVVATCSPFLLFGLAVWAGRRAWSVICTLLGLVIAIVFGALGYYEAFRVHQHGEADALAVVFVPIVQAVIGLLVLLIAVGDRLHFRLSKAN